MTLPRTDPQGTRDEPAAPVPPVPTPTPRPTRLRLRLGTLPTFVYAAAVGLLTTVLRLTRLGQSGDVFVDEPIYRRLGESAAAGGFPRTDEGTFFLHPPGYFYLEAGWTKVVGEHTGIIAGVHSSRVLNALLAGVTAALIVFLVARVRSRGAGVVAGLVFALDAYCIRQNDRVLLETSTMVWILAGYLVLVGLARPDPPTRPRARALLAGLFFGLAILTKDHAVLITLLPLCAALILGWGPPRRLVALTGAVAVASYAVYLFLIAVFGHFEEFWEAKTAGVRRLLGLVQETGFNAAGAPPLSDRFLDELPAFAGTYLLLALTPVALFLLLRRKEPVYRLLALFHASAIVTLGYAVGIGTLEEQALYLLFVPNLVALAVTVPMPSRKRAARRYVTLGILGALLAVPAASYAHDRWTPDDGFRRLHAYLLDHVPAGTGIVTVDGQRSRGVTNWVLRDDYRLGNWVTPEEQTANDAAYVLVPWRVIEQGYGRSPLAEVQGLTAGLRPVFSFDGPTYGTLALYRLPSAPPLPPPLPGPDVARLAVPDSAVTGPLLPVPEQAITGAGDAPR
ncbi:ArnT family glycosyltransferase [Streptomyces sp. NBC_00691]|uniref:ArnT family glycosyltransferase n=1 Tax=Streptomyces sp. NBC_00691 TaxID=2903671 RepID=UPI002E356C4C|nr:phospholipid carrier-dependent glycosyltransferase [Streptomyces sp. NBC_00691]